MQRQIMKYTSYENQQLFILIRNSSMCIWIVERILRLMAQNSETSETIWEHHHHHCRLHSTCDFVMQRQSESFIGILWRHINNFFIWPNQKRIFSPFFICCPFPLFPDADFWSEFAQSVSLKLASLVLWKFHIWKQCNNWATLSEFPNPDLGQA